MEFTHFNKEGKAMMVDVSEKDGTVRTAVAKGFITMNAQCFAKVREGSAAKGDVLGTARIAGIMGAKKTPELIPLCHNIGLTKAEIDFDLVDKDCAVEVTCMTKTVGVTGVEMEALTGVGIALLTIYDMCKAVDKKMTISDIHLCRKTGGKSGEFLNDREKQG